MTGPWDSSTRRTVVHGGGQVRPCGTASPATTRARPFG
ncbi:hypothetical protein F750_2210 [Streptomyces sp. PAMC 26508]|nr:hypothetical protein F750_2210 [Streptomyces sp. PAMC 26508]